MQPVTNARLVAFGLEAILAYPRPEPEHR